MDLASGTQLGSYTIVAPLGAGGMGEVYRAKDAKLDRDVAIKVLPKHLLQNPDARSRFEREAKAVAALSHPNILAIHDFGEQNGVAFAVIELLEGETLRERLAKGPLPVRKTLELARHMAEGLAAAHDKGIVHRDLKPGNVFLTQDGRLKILDFGLAKTVSAPTGNTQDLTLQEGTDPGTVMGTAGYMSPEQVRGGAVDHRSDIFSFGSVLHEMLTGQQAFTGDSAVETMNAILHADPRDTSTITPGVPLGVDRIIRRCLEKRPEERFQSARDLAFAMGNTEDSSSRSHSQLAQPALDAPKRKPNWLGLSAVLLLGAALGGLAGYQLKRPQIPEPVRVMPLTHTGMDDAPSASPDGAMIAFHSNRDGKDRIWLRQMSGGSEAALTEGPDSSPRFSNDGSQVLFVRQEGSVTSVYRVPVVGGQARKVIHNARSGDWSPDDSQIVFNRPGSDESNVGTLIGIANAQSGEERDLVMLSARNVYGLRWSPDGKSISGTSTSAVLNTPDDHLVIIDAASGEVRKVGQSPRRKSAAAWSSDSKTLTYAESTSLLGDISSTLGRVLRIDPWSGDSANQFWVQSVYAGGADFVTIDYLTPNELVYDEIIWRGSLTELDLTGSLPLAPGPRITNGNSRDRQPAYSPDGTTIIFSSNRSGNLDLWTLNPTTGVVRQLTDDEAEDWDPAFSIDGTEMYWSSNRGGHLEIWASRLDGTGARQISQDGVDAENPNQTADGEWIVYSSAHPEKSGMWRIRPDGSDATQIVSGVGFLPDLSPDGKHVSYALNDTPNSRTIIRVAEVMTGKVVFETYVTFAGFQNMTSPGRTRWMPDGQAILFVDVAPNGKTGVSMQDFVPGQDTRASRRNVAGFTEGFEVESFGISPDGTRITVSHIEHFRSIKLAQGIGGR